MPHSRRFRVVRKVATRIIKDLRFDVVEAGDGAEALEICRKQMPEAVLLDWNMPVMNGLDFLRALRRGRGRQKAGCHVLLDRNDAEHVGEALRSGADEFIMKPFDAGDSGKQVRRSWLDLSIS